MSDTESESFPNFYKVVKEVSSDIVTVGQLFQHTGHKLAKKAACVCENCGRPVSSSDLDDDLFLECIVSGCTKRTHFSCRYGHRVHPRNRLPFLPRGTLGHLCLSHSAEAANSMQFPQYCAVCFSGPFDLHEMDGHSRSHTMSTNSRRRYLNSHSKFALYTNVLPVCCVCGGSSAEDDPVVMKVENGNEYMIHKFGCRKDEEISIEAHDEGGSSPWKKFKFTDNSGTVDLDVFQLADRLREEIDTVSREVLKSIKRVEVSFERPDEILMCCKDRKLCLNSSDILKLKQSNSAEFREIVRHLNTIIDSLNQLRDDVRS